MEEKEEEPVHGSDGGGEVKDMEERTPGGSEGSNESKTSNMSNIEGGKRETVGSMVSPSLDRIIVPDARDDSKDEGSINPEMSAKNRKRIKDRERKKAKRDKAIKDKMNK